ncbi:hypothetical protein [Streptomyces sp. RFCAC02]|uniref:hypothetical protein n=1 Tax=Streptomyces sp. RFCAC02 TaxID=2499143 RepID=UPI0010220117|nr:hypothetical protein [Streptomyces sp. RFCAC02]
MSAPTTPAADPSVPKERLPRAGCVLAPDGRLGLDVTRIPEDAVDPVLLFVLRPKKGRPETETRTVPLTRDDDGAGWHGELPAGPPLTEGRWDVFVVPAPGRARLRVLPGLRELRHLAEGGPVPDGSPLAVRLPYATKDAYFAVRAWVRPGHAEAGDILVDGDGMTAAVRLVGVEAGAGAAALLRLRGSGSGSGSGSGKDVPAIEAELRDAGDGTFTFTAPYDRIPPAADGEDEAYWDVFVRPARKAGRVRVGRLLDDVADKKPVFVYPPAILGGMTVQPYYTVDNDLALRVSR